MHEHGPRGGDEINIPEAGKNYGWPVIGFGIDYSGAKIHEGTHKAGMEQPIRQWTPVIAPSGFTIYQRRSVSGLEGQCRSSAACGTQMLVRLELDGEKVTQEERLLGSSTSASATCARAPTAHYGWSPTIRRGASCG